MEADIAAIRSASPADRAQIARSMASAFSEDPLMGWMVGRGAPLEPRMRIFFDAVAKMNLRKPNHLVLVDENGDGAAIWQAVGDWKVASTDVIRAMPAFIRVFRTRVPVMVGALNAIEKAHPDEPHYYLEFLGTRKDRQSKGIGSALLHAMLERSDEEGLPAYLESSNPRNIPFYARHGFTVRGEVDCGKGAPVCTTMWREPRS